MLTMKKVSGVALAITAAGLFATAPMAANAGSSEAKVHCTGVNACKGKSDCKTVSNACKGQNNCKGQGFVAVSEKTCNQIGGKAEK